MKTILLVTFLTWYSYGSSSVQSDFEMTDFDQCLAVKKNLLEIAKIDKALGNTDVSAICLEIPK